MTRSKMPLIKTITASSDVLLGIWRMDESIEELLIQNPKLISLKERVSSYKSEKRKQEIITVHNLLHVLTNNSSLIIDHNSVDKPLVKGFHVSVSHTRGYAAVILSKSANVAVDIEYFSDRVQRVASHFLRTDEPFTTLPEQLISWSAKETAYKYFSEEALLTSQMRIMPFNVSASGKLLLHNMKSDTCLAVHYQLTDDYVLAYSFGD